MKPRWERRRLIGTVTVIAACSVGSTRPPGSWEVLEASSVVVAPGLTVPLLMGVSHGEDHRASGRLRMGSRGCRWENNRAPANAYGAFVALAESPGSRAVRSGPGGVAGLAFDLPTRAAAVALVQPARVVACANRERTQAALRVDAGGRPGDRWSVFKVRGGFTIASVVRQPGWVCPDVDDGTERGAQAECACLFAHASAWRPTR